MLIFVFIFLRFFMESGKLGQRGFMVEK